MKVKMTIVWHDLTNHQVGSLLRCLELAAPVHLYYAGQENYWRAGSSQPSRSAGTIFLYISLRALPFQINAMCT